MQATEQEALLFNSIPYRLVFGWVTLDSHLYADRDQEGTLCYGLQLLGQDTLLPLGPRSVLAGPRQWTVDGWLLGALAFGVAFWVGVGAVVLWLARGG